MDPESDGSFEQIANLLRLRSITRQGSVESDDVGSGVDGLCILQVNELFADAVSKPKTKAAIVAIRPIASFTTSFDSGLR
jgi:hypothetical protein